MEGCESLKLFKHVQEFTQNSSLSHPGPRLYQEQSLTGANLDISFYLLIFVYSTERIHSFSSLLLKGMFFLFNCEVT